MAKKSIKALETPTQQPVDPLVAPVTVSLRDQFAMAAISGLTQGANVRFNPQIIAQRAYLIADAMVWQANHPVAPIRSKM
jgi:hypothetical protein